MAIVINGSGTVTGLAVGGLPDGTVDEGTLATDAVTAAKIPDTVEAGFKSGRKNIMFNGDMKFNIIIRYILYYKNVSEISVASGVVIDSNAKNEFNENFIKAKALIDLYKWYT